MRKKEAYRTMFNEYADVVNVEQMCEMLGISTKTGYKIIKEERITCLKVGRAYKIPKISIIDYLLNS